MPPDRRAAYRAAEAQVVLRKLSEYGISFDDLQVAEAIALSVVDSLDDFRRRVRPVAARQCGAPTNKGWPCRNERLPGNSGCQMHPHWRERQ